jgi:thiopurine S-methyltransferase
MDPKFWHERWEANQIGFHQNHINPHLVRYWPELNTSAGSRVFVPLCGKSADMLWLLEQGHRVLGVEISSIAVEAFFAENNLQPARCESESFTRFVFDELELLCGDFFDLMKDDLGPIDALYDRASLVAFPEMMRQRYVTHLAKLLDPGTRGLLVTLDYPQHEMEGPPFAVPEEEIYRLLRDAFAVDHTYGTSILAENPNFRAKGLSRLEEHVYFLKRH